MEGRRHCGPWALPRPQPPEAEVESIERVAPQRAAKIENKGAEIAGGASNFEF